MRWVRQMEDMRRYGLSLGVELEEELRTGAGGRQSKSEKRKAKRKLAKGGKDSSTGGGRDGVAAERGEPHAVPQMGAHLRTVSYFSLVRTLLHALLQLMLGLQFIRRSSLPLPLLPFLAYFLSLFSLLVISFPSLPDPFLPLFPPFPTPFLPLFPPFASFIALRSLPPSFGLLPTMGRVHCSISSEVHSCPP